MVDTVQRVVDPFLSELDRTLDGRYSAILFGSAARGDFVPGRSDVNVIVILDDASPATLRALQPAFAVWRRSSPVPPLVITREEWARAADAFAIEVCDLRSAYRVLRGPDLVAGLTPDPADLRRALEHQFRGKLLRLRQAYAVAGGDAAVLGEAAAASAATIVTLLRCTLAAAGRPAPTAAADVIAAAADLVGFPADSVAAIYRHRGERAPRSTPAEYEAYLDAVARTARFVDQLQPGESPR